MAVLTARSAARAAAGRLLGFGRVSSTPCAMSPPAPVVALFPSLMVDPWLSSKTRLSERRS